jgi:hypothetical protein
VADCSSVHVLLWVRECSQRLFALLDLAAGVHERINEDWMTGVRTMIETDGGSLLIDHWFDD